MNKFFRKNSYTLDSALLDGSDGEKRRERRRSSRSDSEAEEKSLVGGGGFDNYAYDEDVEELERSGSEAEEIRLRVQGEVNASVEPITWSEWTNRIFKESSAKPVKRSKRIDDIFWISSDERQETGDELVSQTPVLRGLNQETWARRAAEGRIAGSFLPKITLPVIKRNYLVNNSSGDDTGGESTDDVSDGNNETGRDDDSGDEFDKVSVDGISRANMKRRILQSNEEMCTAGDCPYNQWLYEDSPFPTRDQVAHWWDRSSLVSEPRLSTLPSTRTTSFTSCSSSSTLPSTPSSRPRPELHFPPPPPLTQLATPSRPSSPYPIVTLPRSSRKAIKAAQAPRRLPPPTSSRLFRTTLLRLCCLPLLPKPKVPPPPYDRCSPTSCSSGSSCSSCVEVPTDPSSPYAFTVNTKRETKTCDQVSCVVGLFVTVAVLSLTGLLLYLAFNTSVMKMGMS